MVLNFDRISFDMRKIISGFFSAVADFLETFLFFAAIFTVFYFFIAQPHEVTGSSMLPNFIDGEHLLSNKVSYMFSEPKRGDVVTFKFPKAPQFDYIKRIIGLPGEQIMLKDEKIFIFNAEHPEGFVLKEAYLSENLLTEGKDFLSEGKKVLIPKGNYVVMGDNREKSSDSREWGFVPRRNIIGRAWLRYWPPRALAFIPKAKY